MEIDEILIKEMAEAIIASRMQEAGYNYIVIDDRWESMERDKKGNLIPDPRQFPGGRGYEYQDARQYATWGVDYLKYDWCYHGTVNAQEIPIKP